MLNILNMQLTWQRAEIFRLLKISRFVESSEILPNTTKDLLLNSPIWYPYFPSKQFGGNFLFKLDRLQCVINSYILTTKQLILSWYGKEKIDVDKLAGAEYELKSWTIQAL